MNQETRARIIQEESSRFLDSQFAGLDLSSSPNFANPIADKFEPCDKDGLNNVVLSGTNQLKALAENPDREALEQIAKETGDPELVERIQDDREVAEARAFMAANPSYFRSDDNYDIIRNYIEARGMVFNRDSLAVAYKALSRAGKLEVNPDTPRPLTDHNRRAIALQAASGDVEGAVGRYLQNRMPQQAAEAWMYGTSLQEALDGVADPIYQQLIKEAVWYCWENGRPNYAPTRARRQFIHEYVAGRIPTARLCAWSSSTL
jgi:hypothetical protein